VHFLPAVLATILSGSLTPWSAAVRVGVEPPPPSVGAARAAFGADARPYLSWDAAGGTKWSVRQADGTWTPPIGLGPAGSVWPVGIDRVLVVTANPTVQAREQPAGLPVTGGTPVVPHRYSTFDLDVNRRGDAVLAVTLRRSRRDLWVSMRSSGGDFGPLTRVVRGRLGSVPEYAISINEHGSALVVWQERDRLMVRRGRDGRLGPERLLRRGIPLIGNSSVDGVSAELADDGRAAIFVYRPHVSVAVLQSASGGVYGPFTIRPTPGLGFDPPAIVMTDHDGVILWRSKSGGVRRLWASVVRAHSLAPARPLPSGVSVSGFSAGSGPGDEIGVVWNERRRPGAAIVAALRRRGRWLTSREQISPPGTIVPDSGVPSISFDPCSHRIVAAWMRFVPAHGGTPHTTEILASDRDALGPTGSPCSPAIRGSEPPGRR